jgi:1-acyl-sn-glycerol-3-phosphate acyltransferase
VVINHLGDADVVLLAASIHTTIDGMGKIELNAHWLVGPLFRAYGVIWVHRGKADRKAVRAALDGLSQGRMIALAPEGRQSLNRGLEEGTEGAAFLAMKSGAPIVPVAMTGTENDNVYGHMRRLRRAPVTFTVGKPFHLEEYEDRQTTLHEGTERIMGRWRSYCRRNIRGNMGAGNTKQGEAISPITLKIVISGGPSSSLRSAQDERPRNDIPHLSKNSRHISSENPSVVLSNSMTVRLMAACMA